MMVQSDRVMGSLVCGSLKEVERTGGTSSVGICTKIVGNAIKTDMRGKTIS